MSNADFEMNADTLCANILLHTSTPFGLITDSVSKPSVFQAADKHITVGNACSCQARHLF